MALRLLLVAAVLGVGLLVPGAATGAVDSLDLEATYEVRAILGYGRGRLSVDSTATVTNPGAMAVRQLTFNLVPLRIGGAVIEAVTVDGRPAASSADDQTLLVNLPVVLGPGGRAEVQIRYRASLAPDADDGNGYFRKADGIVASARWIPWLSRTVAFDRPTIGNPFVTATASRVDVTLTSERPLVYATSGQRTAVSADGLSQTFVAHDVRDFNFAAAPDYLQTSATVGPTTITLFYRDLPAERVMSWAQRAVEFYSANVGDYAWPSLTIAETATPSALESPAHVWLPGSTSGRRIAYLVAHEIAHLWFYGAVGNDQAAEPFADEAISDLLARMVLGSLRQPRCPPDTLDRTIYEYDDACYFETIYVQGGRYLDDYRRAVGDPAFWRGIRSYYATYRYGMGGTRQLLDALDAAAGRDGAAHAALFPKLYRPSHAATLGALARLAWFGARPE
jgi:hypothetical protein